MEGWGGTDAGWEGGRGGWGAPPETRHGASYGPSSPAPRSASPGRISPLLSGSHVPRSSSPRWASPGAVQGRPDPMSHARPPRIETPSPRLQSPGRAASAASPPPASPAITPLNLSGVASQHGRKQLESSRRMSPRGSPRGHPRDARGGSTPPHPPRGDAARTDATPPRASRPVEPSAPAAELPRGWSASRAVGGRTTPRSSTPRSSTPRSSGRLASPRQQSPRITIRHPASRQASPRAASPRAPPMGGATAEGDPSLPPAKLRPRDTGSKPPPYMTHVARA